MDMDYILALGGTIAGIFIVLLMMYLIHRRGIAIRLTAIIMGGVGMTALASFSLGKEGITLARIGITLALLTPTLAGVLTIIVKQIVNPTKQMAAIAAAIAQGDVAQQIDFTRRDELGDLANAFRLMIVYLQDMAAAADLLAQGDLTGDVRPKSEHDALGNAFSRMITYQQDIAAAAERLAQNDLTVVVTPQSEKDVLGNAFTLMIVNLQSRMNEVQTLVNHLNHLPTPVVTMDRDLNVTFVNLAGANVVGLPLEQCLGKKCYDLFRTPHCHTPECRCAQAMQQDRVCTGETTATPRGFDIPIQYTGAPIKDAGGQIVGVLEYIVDITELRQLMNEANDQREYLEKQVNKLVAGMELLSQGDLSASFSAEREDEIARIVTAANTMIEYLREMAAAADRLAQGDISADVKPQSEHDALGNAFSRMITYQQDMAAAAGRLAQGDLTSDVTPQSEQDALGNSFAFMIANLRELIGQVRGSAFQVAAASQQINSAAEQSAHATNQVAGTMQQIAQSTVQQAESLSITMSTVQQVARAIDGVARGAQEQAIAVNKSAEITAEISSAIQQVMSNTQAGAQSSTQAAQTAREGAKTIAQTVAGMQGIKEKVGLSAQRVQEMGQHSEQISLIVETIDGIASQTNLLALNAAIEAARAGVHGKGFAVVADEVRKLAENTAGATKEISALIKGIQKTVAEAVQAMNEGAIEVEAGVVRAGESGQALESILQAVETVNRQMDEISAAARQMTEAAGEMVQSMDSVSAVVEENTAATEEMAVSASEVSESVESIASISEENSAATEEVSASVEEVSAMAEEVSASAQSLSAMAADLQALVAQFNLPNAQTPALQQHRQPAPAQTPPVQFEPTVLSGDNGQGYSQVVRLPL